MSLKCHAVGSRAARGRNWSPRSRNLCSEGRALGTYFSVGDSQGRGAGSWRIADVELRISPSSSLFRSSTSSARRSPSTASASSFAHKLCCRPSRDELVLRAESPAARPSWGVEPAASIARRRRSRSCHGRRAREAAPRRRGGAKSAMNGELSSDATPLAKGCECESFGSLDPRGAPLEGKVK